MSTCRFKPMAHRNNVYDEGDFSHCIPVHMCMFCGSNPRISSGISYCNQCDTANIPAAPSRHFPKCNVCERYHAAPRFVIKNLRG